MIIKVNNDAGLKLFEQKIFRRLKWLKPSGPFPQLFNFQTLGSPNSEFGSFFNAFFLNDKVEEF